MKFNSFEFIIFLAVFLLIWPIFRRWITLRLLTLVAFSFFFYGWWKSEYVILLIISGAVDYFSGMAIARFPGKGKRLVWLSVVTNLCILFVFKYTDFFIENHNYLLNVFGFDGKMKPMNFVLPIGISFFTFQSMSYTIDVYKGNIKATPNFFHFLAYISLFPQLVAGPIIRSSDLLYELVRPNLRPNVSQKERGIRLIIVGYFKKVVIADWLAQTVDMAFNHPDGGSLGPYWWIIMAMFGFQIYCDFSGYSDIARGLMAFLGVDIPLNFNHPYLANSFRNFWERWHISLSTWFRDYIYIPLGGSRNGEWNTHRNLWLTMLLSGFWHGASWNFIIWGGSHAFLVSLERFFRRFSVPVHNVVFRALRHFRIVLVFALVTLVWTFFRADSLGQAFGIIDQMFSLDGIGLEVLRQWFFRFPAPFFCFVLILIRQLYVYLIKERRLIHIPEYPSLEMIGLSLLIVASVFLRAEARTFIYFNF